MHNEGGSQTGPFVSSQLAPSAARATHVAWAWPLASQVPDVQSVAVPFTSPQGCPAAAVAAVAVHTALMHCVPGSHTAPVVPPHAPPEGVGATHVVVWALHSKPSAHWWAAVHGWLAVGPAAHVPQGDVEYAQNPDWHWPAAWHGEPFASGPSTCAQAEGGLAPTRKSLQAQLGICGTHASMFAGVFAFWGAASALLQFWATRVSQFASLP
jgi:hypothetical protein